MNATCQAYNPQLCNVVHHQASGSLPFTGLDLLLLVALAALLILAGVSMLVVVRRSVRRLQVEEEA